jgi:hypothetical protein
MEQLTSITLFFAKFDIFALLDIFVASGKNIRFNMSGMCCGQNVRFSMAAMCCGQKRQIQHAVLCHG